MVQTNSYICKFAMIGQDITKNICKVSRTFNKHISITKCTVH